MVQKKSEKNDVESLESQPVEEQTTATAPKPPEQMTSDILARDYVFGMVKEISPGGVRIAVTAPIRDIEVFAVITPATKFYQEDEGDTSSRVEIALEDLTVDSFVKVVADGTIGHRPRLGAVGI